MYICFMKNSITLPAIVVVLAVFTFPAYFFLKAFNSNATAKSPVDFAEQAKNDNAFVDSCLYLQFIIDSEESCNRVVKHIVGSPKTFNKDSVEKAVELVLYKFYSPVLIKNTDCGALIPRAGIFLYKTKEDYTLEKWYAAASVSRGNPPRIMLSFQE